MYQQVTKICTVCIIPEGWLMDKHTSLIADVEMHAITIDKS